VTAAGGVFSWALSGLSFRAGMALVARRLRLSLVVLRAGPARGERVDYCPELGDLELGGGTRTIDGQANLGQAGRSSSGFGFLDGAEELQPAGGGVLVMC
jgi:hypothetical protein